MPRPKKAPKHPRQAPERPVAGPKYGITFSTPALDIQRVSSRLYGFDRAIGGGVPLRTLLEISGYEGVGKSTFCEYLLGINGGPTVAILPFESYDPEYLRSSLLPSGFQGEVWEVPSVDGKGVIRDDEDMLDALAEKLAEEDVKAALLDSIGAISPIAEEEGSVREANMGRRAKVMGVFMRKAERVLLRHRKTPAFVLMTNHSHPNIGVPGTNTSGGKAVKFHCATCLRLTSLENYDDGSKLIEGKVTKLRFRPAGTPNQAAFQVVLKAGQGVHVGLTAVKDACAYGLAEETGGRVSMGGKAYGFFSKLLYEKFDDPEVFAPFVDALANYKE